MNPAFSNVVIRDVTPVFFESVYKVVYFSADLSILLSKTPLQMKDMWDQLIESDHQVIDVQTWCAFHKPRPNMQSEAHQF